MQAEGFSVSPASEVPTYAGSSDLRKSRRKPGVPTPSRSAFLTTPVGCPFPFYPARSLILSFTPSPSFTAAITPRTTIALAPPRSALPVLLPVVPSAPCPAPLCTCPYPSPPPCALVFPRIGCGLEVGVEKIPLVEVFALVDWFLACDFVLLRLLRSRSKVLPWRRTLTPMYLLFCLYSFFLSTPLSPLFGCVLCFEAS